LVTVPPRALAASPWVTTEQELKFAVETAAVVDSERIVVVEPVDAVVVDRPDAVVVGAAVEGLEDEPHAASATRAAVAIAMPTTRDRRLIGPHSGGMMGTRWSVCSAPTRARCRLVGHRISPIVVLVQQ